MCEFSASGGLHIYLSDGALHSDAEPEAELGCVANVNPQGWDRWPNERYI
jgi:hypothetical protein